ncbi:hypothetical protein NE865_06424 [Phthorimaea operculella]|nr:hypothetical protein NE865_06424 [Phthorimaea operculella]
MKQMLKLFLVIITALSSITCTIDGLTYMDDIKQRYLDGEKKFLRREDPCNPLYWYPRNIPESCMHKDPPMLPKTESPPPEPVPIPVPIAPHPYPVPAPMPYPMPMPFPMPPSPFPMPPAPFPMPPSPFPMPPPPFPMPHSYGFVPGVPGMVSRDGGINVLPFSDVYSDMLEKHKQKMIRKEMQHIIEKYNKKHKWHGSRRLYNN